MATHSLGTTFAGLLSIRQSESVKPQILNPSAPSIPSSDRSSASRPPRPKGCWVSFIPFTNRSSKQQQNKLKPPPAPRRRLSAPNHKYRSMSTDATSYGTLQCPKVVRAIKESSLEFRRSSDSERQRSSISDVAPPIGPSINTASCHRDSQSIDHKIDWSYPKGPRRGDDDLPLHNDSEEGKVGTSSGNLESRRSEYLCNITRNVRELALGQKGERSGYRRFSCPDSRNNSRPPDTTNEKLPTLPGTTGVSSNLDKWAIWNPDDWDTCDDLSLSLLSVESCSSSWHLSAETSNSRPLLNDATPCSSVLSCAKSGAGRAFSLVRPDLASRIQESQKVNS